MLWLYVLLALAGLAGGFLGGMLGIGGGIIFVLVLPMVWQTLGMPRTIMADYTVANSLFATLFSSLSANYAASKAAPLPLRQIFMVGVPGSAASLLTLHYVVTQPWYNMLVFEIVVSVLLAFMLLRMWLLAPATEAHRSVDSLGTGALVLLGAGAGFVAALSGLGGGIIMVPVLNNLLRIPIKSATGLSLGVIGVTSLVASLYNMTLPAQAQVPGTVGLLVFPVALSLAAGVLAGSPLGVRTARKLSDRQVQYLFMAFVALNLVQKLWSLSRHWVQ